MTISRVARRNRLRAVGICSRFWRPSPRPVWQRQAPLFGRPQAQTRPRFKRRLTCSAATSAAQTTATPPGAS